MIEKIIDERNFGLFRPKYKMDAKSNPLNLKNISYLIYTSRKSITQMRNQQNIFFKKYRREQFCRHNTKWAQCG